jgi:hypothetical protein
MLKRLFVKWLRERALRLPSDKVDELAKRLRVPREAIVAVNDAIIEWVVKQID